MGGMLLILNTAEKNIQFVLSEDGENLCSQSWIAKRGGTELLIPALHDACSRLGRSLSSIDRIACTAGPGNFTGIRIGITTASGLAHALGSRQAGINYLQCLACGVHARPGQTVEVLTNARKGLAYRARFEINEDGLPPVSSVSLVEIPPVPADIPGNAPDILIGSAVTSNLDQIKPVLSTTTFLPGRTLDIPSPAALLRAASFINWDLCTQGDIAPVYARECDAMDNFDAIAVSQGRTPELARAELNRMLAAEFRDR